MKNLYTIMVMSDDSSVRQFSIGRWSLRLLYFLFFIIIVSAFGSIGYGIFSRNQLQSIHTENNQFKSKIESQQKQLDSLNQEMQEIRQMADLLRTWSGLDPQKGILGQGGDGFDSEEMNNSEPSDLILNAPPAVMTTHMDFTDESLAAQVLRLKNEVEPVYEHIKGSVKQFSETPSILPIEVPTGTEKKSYWFSSGFGYRTHPLTRKRQFHRGLDISTRRGTPVIAAADGVIVQAKRDRYLGKMIEIKHEAQQTIKTQYGHLQKYAEGIRVGKKVVRGETIGYVGNTGRTTGTHLHYGVYEKGWQNPLKYIILDIPPTR